KAIFRRDATDKELVTVGRIATVAIALIAAIIAINPDSSVLDLVGYAWAGFGAAFGPIIVLSLFWKRITRGGAIAGIIVGAATVADWADFLSGGIFELHELALSFVFNSIVTVIVSLRSKPEQSILDEFDETVHRASE